MSVSIKVQNALNFGVRIAAYVYDNDRGDHLKAEAIKALKTGKAAAVHAQEAGSCQIYNKTLLM